jgi:MoaA/NifB/PqqE/SkfB family radical SAM enzyme
MAKMWGRRALRTLWRTRGLHIGLVRSKARRDRVLREQGLKVPIGIALSPTMTCNLSCEGCYARYHSRDEELPLDVIDALVGSAADAGVFLFVVTGGEPYLRQDMVQIYRKYPGALFLTVTNGSAIDSGAASEIADCGNVFPVVSLEGERVLTDARRGEGAYEKALEGMAALKAARVPFGFSAVLTTETISVLGRAGFVQRMVDAGCTVGFYNDFIPLAAEDLRLVPDGEQFESFKADLRRRRREGGIILLHLPDDEYDAGGRCMAVGSGAFHVNARGDVEPCPFCHYARENVKRDSFLDILRSPFLEALRSHPTVLQRGAIGCSLVNNCAVVEEIAGSTGATATTDHTVAFEPELGDALRDLQSMST